MVMIRSAREWVFTCMQYKSFETTVGKGEIARNEHFLLFPQRFLSFWRTFCPFHQIQKLFSANSLSLEESKFFRLGKGFNPYPAVCKNAFILQKVLKKISPHICAL